MIHFVRLVCTCPYLCNPNPSIGGGGGGATATFITSAPPLYQSTFRVTTITDLLEQGVPLEDVQRLAGHADPRTTRLYDRRQKKITRNIVERISI